MRAAKIFTNDLKEAGVLDRVKTLKVALCSSSFILIPPFFWTVFSLTSTAGLSLTKHHS
jgi:hypothetical protein